MDEWGDEQGFIELRVVHSIMAVELQRPVEFSMIDMANIAYYPRLFDLAHRFFEASWVEICGITYPEIVQGMGLGFPVVNTEAAFLGPVRYGDTITAKIVIKHIGTSSLTWGYEFHNQHQEMVWRSTQVTVCVSMDSMASTPIPNDLRAGLEQHLEVTEDGSE